MYIRLQYKTCCPSAFYILLIVINWYSTYYRFIALFFIIQVSFLIAQLCLSTGYLVLPLDTLNKALVGGAAVFNVIDSVRFPL